MFVDRPDVTGLSFDEKLAVQLGDASDDARLLFAELYYLNLLPLSDYKGGMQRSLINGGLGELRSPVTAPAAVDRTSTGACSTAVWHSRPPLLADVPTDGIRPNLPRATGG